MSTVSSSSGTTSTPVTTFYSNGTPVLWPETHGSATYIWSTILVITFALVAFYIWRLFKARAQQRAAAAREIAAEARAPKSSSCDPEKPFLYDAYLISYSEDDQYSPKGRWNGVMPLSAIIREDSYRNSNSRSSYTLLGNSSPPPHRATLVRSSTSSTLSTLIDHSEGSRHPVEVSFLVAMPSPPGPPESGTLDEFSAGPELVFGSTNARSPQGTLTLPPALVTY